MTNSGEKKLNILVVLLYWYPYIGPATPILGGIFRELHRRGHKVTIISSFPHFRSGTPETWHEYRGRLFQRTRWEDADLLRTWVFAPVFRSQKLGLVYRALNYMSFNISSAIAGIVIRGDYDIVFTLSSPPLTNGIVGGLIAKLRGARAVFDVVDIYPDIAVKMNIWSNLPALSVMKLLEKVSYRLSSRIVVLSDGMKGSLKDRGVTDAHVEVIPNYIQVSGDAPLPKDNPFAREYGLHEKFVVMYAGNVGIGRGVEILVEAAELLRDHEDILFCIVGRGEHKDELVRQAEQRGLTNVVFPPRQPEENVPYIFSSADVSACTYKKGLAEFSVPSKLLAIMASARPAIISGERTSDAGQLVDEAGCGVCVPAEDARAFADAVLELHGDRERARAMGLSGFDHVRQHFTLDAVADKFENLFLELASS